MACDVQSKINPLLIIPLWPSHPPPPSLLVSFSSSLWLQQTGLLIDRRSFLIIKFTRQAAGEMSAAASNREENKPAQAVTITEEKSQRAACVSWALVISPRPKQTLVDMCPMSDGESSTSFWFRIVIISLYPSRCSSPLPSKTFVSLLRTTSQTFPSSAVLRWLSWLISCISNCFLCHLLMAFLLVFIFAAYCPSLT